MCYEIEIEPRDIMYFRDGKPIGASADGSGATWPLPTTFHSAMLSKLNAQLGDEIKEWEGSHNRQDNEPKNVRFNFGGLKTWGPFPQENGEIYLPTPADLLPAIEKQELVEGKRRTGGYLTPVEITGSKSNLPKPLKYPVASTNPPSKESVGEWISISEYQKYLKGDTALETRTSASLFSSEARPGIAIDATTGATEDSKFYSAEYLRLKKGVSMTAFAECEAKEYNSATGKDVLQELFRKSDNSAFIFGGQRGVAWLENKREKNTTSPMSIENKNRSVNVKWTLVSPAYNKAGWLPGWVSEEGDVKLKEQLSRGTMTRKEWREKLKNMPFIKATLEAARIPKPITVSGWKLDVEEKSNGAAKATKLFTPAGAVYYFKCDNKEEAKKLIKALHGQTKSDFLGEQGFGFGLCSTWSLKKI